STIREADVIVVIDHGNVVEQGSHEQLLDAGGMYHDLYTAQTQQDLKGGRWVRTRQDGLANTRSGRSTTNAPGDRGGAIKPHPIRDNTTGERHWACWAMSAG